MGFLRNKPTGMPPHSYITLGYRPDPTQFTKQDYYTSWPYGYQTTQYGQRATEFWWGNQLPNSSINIPGVPNYTWSHPRINNTQNSHALLTGGAYNKPLSIAQANTLMRNAQNAWANQYGGL